MLSNKLGRCFYRSAADNGADLGTLDKLATQLGKLPWEDVYSLGGILTRRSCWFTELGCTCPYKYGKKHKEKPWQPNKYPDWLSEVSRKIEEMLGLPQFYYNSCNGNMYSMPSHDLSFHKDDEPLFREAEAPSASRNVSIASLSFGQTRKFQIRKSYSGNAPIEVNLCDGDLLTMEGLMQDNYMHAVSATSETTSQASSSTSVNVRYNLTFRRIMRHVSGCPKKQY